jgi:hypothetical protein
MKLLTSTTYARDAPQLDTLRRRPWFRRQEDDVLGIFRPKEQDPPRHMGGREPTC